VNKLKLESIMKLNGDTGTSLALFLGIARSTFSAKLNETNGAEFSQKEILAIKEKYNLTADEVVGIFFDQKVSCKDTEKKEGRVKHEK